MKQFVALIFVAAGILISNLEVKAQPITWQKVLNFTDNCGLNKAHQTSDGGYVAVGESRVNNHKKIFLVKFNRFGDTLWTKYFDTNVNAGYIGYWVEETLDKGYVIAGVGEGINSDAYLIKTDSLGSIQWYKTFGGSDLDQASCVKQIKDKGYILLITTSSFGPTTDILVVRTDSLGNTLWSKVYGGNNFSESAREIEVVNNSGFILTGKVVQPNDNLYLLRLNENGDTLWSKTFTNYLGSQGYSIDITNDGGFIVGGTCYTLGTNSYVIKTDSSGNSLWQRTYTTNFNEACFSIRKLKNSGYVMCGMSDSLQQNFERAIVRILDDNGNILREKYYRPGPNENIFYSVEKANDNGFILCGLADFGYALGFIIRTDSLLNIKPVGVFENVESLEDYQLFQNYPNPFNSQTIIKYQVKNSDHVNISIFSITGKEICTLVNEYKHPGIYTNIFDADKFALSSGIYFYKLTLNYNNKIFLSKKLFYIK